MHSLCFSVFAYAKMWNCCLRIPFLLLGLNGFEEEVCYGQLGCFGDGSPFTTTDSKGRLWPLLPWSPEEICTEFWLYTRGASSKHVLSYNNERSIQESNFNSSRKTVLIVHGFLSNGNIPHIRRLRSALLRADDVNVIVVDWEKGAKAQLDVPHQSSANARVVGAQIALLIKHLQIYAGARPVDCHIIGHSLGAHVAGYAGERIPGLGRITGLDVAGPLFQNTHPTVRLDSGDAQYVDTIHTDAWSDWNLGWGMLDPIGHASFYPNGGSAQPGCPGNRGLDWIIMCDHIRAWKLLIDSIENRNAPMIGHECRDYDAYVAGECTTCGENKCAQLGYYSTKVHQRYKGPVKYYLKTKSHSPFAMPAIMTKSQIGIRI